MNRVVKMKIGPFGNHVVGPGFPVDVADLVGEGKFVTLQTAELYTREFEEHNHVDTVVTAAEFPNAVREILQRKENRKVLTRFMLTRNHYPFETPMIKIPDYGMIMGDGHAFDLEAWEESRYTLFAGVEVLANAPELDLLPGYGAKEETLIKIMD